MKVKTEKEILEYWKDLREKVLKNIPIKFFSGKTGHTKYEKLKFIAYKISSIKNGRTKASFYNSITNKSRRKLP